MTDHVRPNYILIWGYLFVLTVIEVLAAFVSHIPKHWLIIILVLLAFVKAFMVAMYFMHLKFERWRLRLIFIIPLPLAAILVLATITEKIW